MSTRCNVCAQEASKKCTDCGEVFCDLHIRLAGQAGGMYGRQASSIGYFCDACWERRLKRRKSTSVVLTLVGLVLLGVNVLGFMAFKGSFDIGPRMGMADFPAVLIVVLVLMVMVGLIVAVKRRR